MKARTVQTEGMGSARYAELKRILEERRREILSEVKEKMRDVRAEGASGEGQGVLDAAEASEGSPLPPTPRPLPSGSLTKG